MRRLKRPWAPGTALQSYLNDLPDRGLLSRAEERELAERIALGDSEARETLISANLRLVIAIASRYKGRDVSLEDLIAEGNLGLIRAAEGYDPSMQTRFSTYAAYWIKQSIRNCILKSGTMIRTPHYMHALLAKWRRAAAVLADRLGREPSPEEIGGFMKLSASKLRIVRTGLEAAELARQPSEASNSDGNGSLLEEIGPNILEQMPDERAETAEAIQLLIEHLGQLDDRRAAIIRMRYGLVEEAPLTLRAIGERLGLTRERVRQLEQTALAELAEAV